MSKTADGNRPGTADPGDGVRHPIHGLDRDHGDHPDRGLVFRSQPHRLKEDEQFRVESEEFSSMMQKWVDSEYKPMLEKMTKMEKKGIPYHAFGNSAPRGEKHLYQSALMFR